MPPRSAKRKAPARAKKKTPKPQQLEVLESSNIFPGDENTTVFDFELNDSPEESTQLENVLALPAIEEEKMKHETESLHQAEEFISGTSSLVNYRVEEELVELEKDIGNVEKKGENMCEEKESCGFIDGLQLEIGLDIDNVIGDHNLEGEMEMEAEKHKNCNENVIFGEEKGENESEENESCAVGDGLQSVIVLGTDSVTEERVDMEVENDKNWIENDIVMEEKGQDVCGEREGASGNDGLQPAIVSGRSMKGEDAVGEDDEGDDKNNKDNKHDEDPCICTHDILTYRREQKNLEIFIGRLGKKVVEDDLIKVFGTFGEIKSTRIIRTSTSKRSKGYAFIQYATKEQAETALSKSKAGLEVRGKRVTVSASQYRDTLHVGNICKTWTKELILEMLKNYGVDNIEEIRVPNDPKKVGRIKGFAFLEFSTHSDAMAAFQRLQKPDAVFGLDISAKVAFAQISLHPNEESLSQVKSVRIEGLTDAWNKEKLNEICKQYGEIVEVKLYQNLGTKLKNYGFVTFHSRESALAFVEGINNARTVEGKVKVIASIAKSHSIGQLQKHFHGGFKVEQINEVSPSKKEKEMSKQSGSSPVKGHRKSKRAKRKGKAKVAEKGGALSESITVYARKIDNFPSDTRGQTAEPTSKLKKPNRKRKTLSTKAGDRGSGGIEHGHNQRPPKKPRGSTQGKPSNNNGNPKRDLPVRKRPYHGTDYNNPYAPEKSSSSAYYQGHGHGSVSASKWRNTDMEPHAGYIAPAAVKQGQPNMGYFDPAVGSNVQRHARYIESAAASRGQPYIGYLEPAVGLQGRLVRYLEPTVYIQGQTHGGYLDSAVRMYGQPHAGYVQPAIGKYGRNLDPQSTRIGGSDVQSSSNYVYGGGSTLTPSYAPIYSSSAGYEGSSAGHCNQRGAAYPPGRAYDQTKY